MTKINIARGNSARSGARRVDARPGEACQGKGIIMKNFGTKSHAIGMEKTLLDITDEDFAEVEERAKKQAQWDKVVKRAVNENSLAELKESLAKIESFVPKKKEEEKPSAFTIKGVMESMK